MMPNAVEATTTVFKSPKQLPAECVVGPPLPAPDAQPALEATLAAKEAFNNGNIESGFRMFDEAFAKWV